MLPTGVILTAVHGGPARLAVTAAMLRHAADTADRLSDLIELRLAAVLSHGDDRALESLRSGSAEASVRVGYITAPDRPISRKWQAGLNAVRSALDPDLVIVLGSDDFATEPYLRAAVGRVLAGEPGVGPDSIWMVDLHTGQMGHWSGPMYAPGGFPMPAGAGRVFSRRMLEAADGQLWPFDANTSLDGRCSAHLRTLDLALGIVKMDGVAGAAVVDVKNGENLHSWDAVRYRHVLDAGPAAARLRDWNLDCVLDLVDLEAACV